MQDLRFLLKLKSPEASGARQSVFRKRLQDVRICQVVVTVGRGPLEFRNRGELTSPCLVLPIAIGAS